MSRPRGEVFPATPSQIERGEHQSPVSQPLWGDKHETMDPPSQFNNRYSYAEERTPVFGGSGPTETECSPAKALCYVGTLLVGVGATLFFKGLYEYHNNDEKLKDTRIPCCDVAVGATVCLCAGCVLGAGCIWAYKNKRS